MSKRELHALLEHASDFCRAAFARYGEVHPMWHAVRRNGEQFAEPHPQELGKDLAAALIRAQFDLLDVIRYVYIGEAWTVDHRGADHSEVMRFAREQRLHEYPGRLEVVQIQGEDAECGQVMAQRVIHRPAGKPAYLGKLEIIIEPGADGIQSEGRLVGLLPVRGRRQ